MINLISWQIIIILRWGELLYVHNIRPFLIHSGICLVGQKEDDKQRLNF